MQETSYAYTATCWMLAMEMAEKELIILCGKQLIGRASFSPIWFHEQKTNHLVAHVLWVD